jgi:phage terminase large subunit-like protein
MRRRRFNASHRRRLAKVCGVDHKRDLSCFEILSLASERERSRFVGDLSDLELDDLMHDWSFMGRPSQQRPNYKKTLWEVWLIQAGRGFGKTRTGAETVKEWQLDGYSRFAAVGRTAEDVRKTMLEDGPSALLNLYPKSWEFWRPDHWPTFEPSKKKVTWGNGATLHMYYDEEPRKLEGPQHEKAWCDETAGWSNMAETFNHLMLGLRLGPRPQVVVTTTPKRKRAYKKLFLEKDNDWNVHVTRGSTYDNVANLSDNFIRKIVKKYEGTSLGKEMLQGIFLEDLSGALWKQDIIDAHRVNTVRLSDLYRIVVAVDPAVSAKDKSKGDDEDSNMTGIVVVGIGYTGHLYVLSDRTVRAKPEVWAQSAVSAYYAFQADCIVGEVNQGGDLVEMAIKMVDSSVPFKQVRATRGKQVRAEPVAIMYERGEVHHVKQYGDLFELEQQMCDWVPGEGESPDRVDALVWGATELAGDNGSNWGSLATW